MKALNLAFDLHRARTSNKCNVVKRITALQMTASFQPYELML